MTESQSSDEINVGEQSKQMKENKKNNLNRKKFINYDEHSSPEDVINEYQQQNDIDNESNGYSPGDSDGSQYMKAIKRRRRVRGKGRVKSQHSNTDMVLLKSEKQLTIQKNQGEKNNGKNKIIILRNLSQNKLKQKKRKKRSVQNSSNSKISDNDNEDSDIEEEREENEIEEQNSHMNRPKNEIFMDEWQNSQQQLQQLAEKIVKKQYKLKEYIHPQEINEEDIPILQPQLNQYKQAQQQKISQPQSQKSKQKIKEVLDYANYYPSYKQRRLMKYFNGKIDLNIRYLHELVYDCYIDGLICKELMINIKNMGLNNSLEFIQKYKEVKLAEFDFKKVKFTVFDHRRLSKLLKYKGKRQYTDECPIFFLPYELHLFMTEVYKLDEDSYQGICNTIDTSYNLTWWKTIGTELQGKQFGDQQLNLSTPSKPVMRNSEKKKAKERMKTQRKDEQKLLEQKLIRIQNEKKNQLDSQQNEESQSAQLKSRSEKLSNSFLYSSQIFETQKMVESNQMLDIDENTHSLSDVSDLLREQSKNQKNKKQDISQMLQQQNYQEQLQQSIEKVSQYIKKSQKAQKKINKKLQSQKKRRGSSRKKMNPKKPKMKTKQRICNEKEKKQKKKVQNNSL